MKIKVERFKHTDNATLSHVYVDDDRMCFGLEDKPQDEKIPGETRIPAGTYQIKLRDAGSMTKKYAERFDFHSGMLWLQDVPDFEYVYIHIGNTHTNTAGCLLVGISCNEEKMTLGQSRIAYEKLYKKVVDDAWLGDLEIEILDEDNGRETTIRS